MCTLCFKGPLLKWSYDFEKTLDLSTEGRVANLHQAAVDKCILTKEGTGLMNGYGSFPLLLLPGLRVGPWCWWNKGQKLVTVL